MKYIYKTTTFIILALAALLVFGDLSAQSQTKHLQNDYSFYLKSGDRSPKWNDFIEPAFSSFDSGNLATAYVFLKRAYEAGCRDGLLLYRLGIYKESLHLYNEAAILLAEAATKIPKQYAKHPLARGIHEHAGRALYQANDFVRALPELEKALEFTPDNFMLLFMSGQILRTNAQPASAREHFKRALKAKPPEGLETDAKYRLLRELIIVTYDLKDLSTCSSYIQQVLAIAPTDPIALSYKQKLEREQQKRKEMEVIERMIQ